MFWVMSVEVRQSVREQPDTGYGKSLPAYCLTAPGCGGGRIDGGLELSDGFFFFLFHRRFPL